MTSSAPTADEVAEAQARCIEADAAARAQGEGAFRSTTAWWTRPSSRARSARARDSLTATEVADGRLYASVYAVLRIV